MRILILLIVVVLIETGIIVNFNMNKNKKAINEEDKKAAEKRKEIAKAFDNLMNYDYETALKSGEK